MDQIDAKAHTQSQVIGVFLVVFGTVALAYGCHFHYAELTTAAAGITGAGINQITNNLRQTMNTRSGPTVNVESALMGAQA